MAQRVEGVVTSITPEGNLVTDITADRLDGAPRDDSVKIRCEEHTTIGIYPPDHKEPPMTYLPLLPEGAAMELTLVGENASAFLGIPLGAAVVVEW